MSDRVFHPVGVCDCHDLIRVCPLFHIKCNSAVAVHLLHCCFDPVPIGGGVVLYLLVFSPLVVILVLLKWLAVALKLSLAFLLFLGIVFDCRGTPVASRESSLHPPTTIQNWHASSNMRVGCVQSCGSLGF